MIYRVFIDIWIYILLNIIVGVYFEGGGYMSIKLSRRDNKGFTLVELIVVIVILAILAAILVPALLGYIEKARQRKYTVNAKNCMTAVQAELTELYAKYGDSLKLGDCIIPEGKNGTSGNGDFDVTNTDFAKRVLNNADMAGDKTPYCFMIAVGSNWNNDNGAGTYTVTKHDKYTVYYAFYKETEDSPPLYYYNGSWTKTNPRAYGTKEVFSSANVVKEGALKGKRLQYYLISNKTGKGSVKDGGFWDWLKSMK